MQSTTNSQDSQPQDERQMPMSPRDCLLLDIERYASIFLPITDMADILGMDPEALREAVNTPGSDVSKAYRRGKASSKVKLLQQEMQLAYLGSPAALEATRSSLLDMEDDE